MEFLERLIPIADGHLATFSAGSGPQIVFVHGGPGSTHQYLKRLASPLLDDYRCILYDQRGSGGSKLEELSFESLAIERHLDDLAKIREAYGIEKLILVGHSWGASLTLFMAMHRPELVDKIALLGMGPLDEEMGRVTNANLQKVFLPQERHAWQKMRHDRKEALSQGKEALFETIEEKMMELRVRAWIYRPELRENFLNEYFAEPPVNRAINEVLSRDALRFFRWNDLDKVRAKIFIGQGQQDYVPLPQAFRLRERLGRVEIRLWNECAHLPWIDQPEFFYWDLRAFLSSV